MPLKKSVMDNGIYITLTRQIGLFNDMDVLANNIANVNTTGYQAEYSKFAEFLVRDGNIVKGDKMVFTNDAGTVRDTNNGTLRATENPLDVAIQGDGFFAVETPLGVRYTRAGAFSVDSEGQLVNASGYPVLDNAGQPITFEETDNEIEIGENGVLKVDGDERAIIGVYRFENPQMLERVSNTLYKSEVEGEITEDVRVNQGMLENSNVQAVNEMTRMIKVSRALGATSKFIDTMYDLQRKTANVLAQQS